MKINSFNITFLGTSAASVSPFSPTSSYLIEVGTSMVIVDAGIGVLRQMRKVPLNPEHIGAILITHWHLDHYAGLPSLIRARGNSNPLAIFGPPLPRTARMFLTAFSRKFYGYFQAVQENFCTDCQDIRLTAIPAAHDIDSLGWVLTEKYPAGGQEARRMVISGDTRPTEIIAGAARGADLLIHEATYLERHARTAFTHKHSTAAEAARLAGKAGAGSLALTHTANRYSRIEVQQEAEKIFPGALVPSPMDRIHIDPLPMGTKKENCGWAHLRAV